MKKLFIICTAILATTYASAAKADEGVYAGVFGGANWLDISERHHAKIDFDTGYLVGGSLGYKWCNGFSVEGEVAYRRNQLDRIKYHGFKADVSGHLRTWSFMANGIYELPIDFCLKPYVGAGIGYANQRIEAREHHHSSSSSFSSSKLSDLDVSSSDSSSSSHDRAKGNANGFAYQLIAGVAYPICADLDLDLEYRFFQGRNRTNNNSVVLGLKKMF